jgi:hypothetical protein
MLISDGALASCGKPQILFPYLKSLLKSHSEECLLIAVFGFLRYTSAINLRSIKAPQNSGPQSGKAFFPLSFNSLLGAKAKRPGLAGCFPHAPLFFLKKE